MRNIADETYRWIVAWSIFGMIVFLINKTKIGHAILYYSLWLLLLFLLLTQYKFIAAGLEPLGQKVPTQGEQ